MSNIKIAKHNIKSLDFDKNFYYSVLLHFVFVYFTYKLAILSFDPEKLSNISFTAFNRHIAEWVGVYILLPHIIFYIVLYYFKFNYFESMKSNDLPWPWEEQNPSVPLKKQIYVYLFNFLILQQLVLFIFSQFYTIYDEVISLEIPPFWKVYIFLWFQMFWEDFLFYFSHRTLHHPKIYKIVHKMHHENYNTININCIYAHPIEFIFGNMLPMFAGFFILGPNIHYVSYFVWVTYRLIETHEAHGGYEFPISVFKANPFGPDANYHNFHHLKNIGNYSSFFTLWDDFFKTNNYYFKKYLGVGNQFNIY